VDYQQLKAAVQAAGHVFFDRGIFNLNIVGVRTAEDAANTFNDRMFVAYRDELGGEQCIGAKITTDPGLKYRVNPINEKGTGIIVPGQHRGVWHLGMHKGIYPALVQRKPILVYRDNDCDGFLDPDPANTEKVLGGFNCHRASSSGTSILVDGWSAGCQVYANVHDHALLISLARRSAAIHGDSFSYTLLRESELDGQAN